MMRTAGLIVAAAMLAGCAIPPLSPEDAAAATDLQLCQTYSAAREIGATQQSDPALAELRRRGLSAREMADIEGQVVRTGQREHVAICAWGPYWDVNETVVVGSRSRQFVLGDFGPYVYTDGRLVTGWQD